jgi:hypothetical protein
MSHVINIAIYVLVNKGNFYCKKIKKRLAVYFFLCAMGARNRGRGVLSLSKERIG